MTTSRRQALQISGAALVSGAAFSLAGCGEPVGAHTWNGEALGAPGTIQLVGVTEARAKSLFKTAEKATARLERIFSLYDPKSEISRLNKQGWLNDASAELIEVLNAARLISQITRGAFDISVQPLWNLATTLRNVDIPKKEADRLWKQAHALVDYRFVYVKDHEISFTRPGVAITLNGIAQGYIADRVADLMQKGGAENGLVNIGEFKAFGKTEAGDPWRIGLQSPINIMEQVETIALHDQGLATSSARAGRLSDALSHIFETRAGRTSPSGRNGRVGPEFASASVVYKSAMVADGFATAFTLMDEQSIADICTDVGGMHAILVRQNGDVVRV